MLTRPRPLDLVRVLAAAAFIATAPLSTAAAQKATVPADGSGSRSDRAAHRATGATAKGDSILLWGEPETILASVSDTGGYKWSPTCFTPPDRPRFCGASATILLSDFAIDLQRSTDPLAASRTWMVRIPYEVLAKAKRLSQTQTLRFFVNKSANARVVIIFDAGGRPTVYDFPRGRVVTGEEFTRTVRSVVPASLNAQALSLTLIVERDAADATAAVNIDSIDLGLNPSPSTATSRPSAK